MAHTPVSRRGFISGCMALAGVAALGLGQVPAAQASEAAETCDVLVIGGGIAGALAALSAQDVGAESVILCEKMGFDSRGYQSLDGMLEAIGIDREKVCTYCWSGRE